MDLCRQVCFCYDEFMFPFISSQQVFELTAWISVTSFIILIIISFMTKAQLSLLVLPHYSIYLYKRIFNHSRGNYIFEGNVVRSSDEKPLQGVTIYATDHQTKKFVSHSITNKQGKFHVSDLMDESYTLSFVKNGFKLFTLQSVSPLSSTRPLHIAMTSNEYHKTIPHFLLYLIVFLLEKGFLGIVLSSFFFCLIIEVSLGWHKVIPYLILSGFSVLTCILHERYHG